VPGAPPDAGELVYRGPSVMLGYANGPSDLGSGRTIEELRTGDLGRRGADGLYEIVGRTGQFLKIAGLRVDLPGVERLIERYGARACAVGSDEQLVVFAEAGAPADLHAVVRESICLPAHAVRVFTLPELPRLTNGKIDRRALQERAALPEPVAPPPQTADALIAIRELYASALGRAEVADEETFSSLGGDSLSYVEVTLGLEEILGRLPDGWAAMSIRELGVMAPATNRQPERWWSSLARWRTIETGVALRALAIVLIVATHIGMIGVAGGAHVLMAVAGFNFARFRLTAAGRTERVRSQLLATARIAIPAMVWVALLLLFTDEYELRHMLLVNALVQDELWGNLWFIELLVYIGLALGAVLAIPAVDRVERRRPFAFAMAVVGIGLLFRFEVLDFGIPYTMPVLWLFALGWAASRADRAWQRALVLALAVLSVPGYFESPERNAVILLGLALLIVVPHIRVPAALAPVAAVLAGASLYIYLVHWETWPMFEGGYGLPSLGASLAAGIALWVVASHLPEMVARVRRWTGERWTWAGGLDLRWVLTR
jgi:AMP-binding enzyme/Phosphopantetheine attachment site